MRDSKGDTIGVVGPGALGLVLASVLSEHGARVVVLDHDRERASRLSLSGVHVAGPGGLAERTVSVVATADASQLSGASLVLVCVKADADARVVSLLANAPREVSLLTLGNGLGRGEALASLGEDRVLVGTTTEGGTLEGSGRVLHAGRGKTLVAGLVASSVDRAKAAVALLSRFGLDVKVADDARRLSWEKVQVNAAINALAGLLDCPNGDLLRSPEARKLATDAAIECGVVALASGVPGDWSQATARSRWEAVATATSANLCSTVQDLRRRRKSEIHAINGAIARAARESGTRAPVNELLAALIGAREELFEAGR